MQSSPAGVPPFVSANIDKVDLQSLQADLHKYNANKKLFKSGYSSSLVWPSCTNDFTAKHIYCMQLSFILQFL